MFQNPQFSLDEEADDFFENLLLKSPQANFDIESDVGRRLENDLQNRTAWFQRIRKSIESLGLTDTYTQSIQTPNNVKNTTYLECWRRLCDTYSSEIFQPMNLLTYEVKYLSFLNQNEELKDKITELENVGKVASEALNL